MVSLPSWYFLDSTIPLQAHQPGHQAQLFTPRTLYVNNVTSNASKNTDRAKILTISVFMADHGGFKFIAYVLTILCKRRAIRQIWK